MNFKSTTGSYLDDRYPFILQVEESGNPHLTPYNDGIGWVTMGVGFNLSDDNVRSQVLAKMGVSDTTLIQKLSDYLKKQYDGIHDEKKDTATMQVDLNNIMDKYTPGATFEFASTAQVKELFDGPNGNDGLAKTYEDRVNDWAQNKGIPFVIPPSQERLVLLSLAYNGALNASTQLATAISSDNRAEAWYQIRFATNSSRSLGLQNRRDQESDLFGLYNDATNVSDTEAKNTFRVFNAERLQTIETYLGQITHSNGATLSSGELVVINQQLTRNQG
ncbi:MAG: hypothetical protein Q7U66_06685 [Methylobacter sp.]|nr:hypothetical protein [Methylobacter sp.]